ncbi:MAG: ribonuclease J [Desulfobacterales bacterium]|nr:ribonuclease J [Desulfobacterales bacterium]
MLKIIPLGGLGEIGLNMMVIEYGDTIFIVDAGLMFPEDFMLGIDYVIPDMAYIRENRSKIFGIILTHAHEDHIGALPFFLKEVNVPVFATRFTLGIVKHKLEERGLLSSTALHEIAPGQQLKIGVFDIGFIHVTHSVVDGVGLAIRTPVGLIVHTGDFKITNASLDGIKTDVNKFALCGQEGVLALLSDSTNVEKEGYTISAQKIQEAIGRIVADCKGRVIIALFASNITRIQRVINIAEHEERKVVFDGRSIEVSIKIAQELGFLKIPPGMEIGIDEMDSYPDDEIILITTGSQGEPMSALARMATGTHKKISVKRADTIVLSSKFIPGNERAITGIINKLYKRGANLIYEKISEIHVSGHAFREELKMMINLTKPKYFIPIHGEYRHLLLHARLAEDIGIPRENAILVENGQVVEFSKDDVRIQGSVPTGRVLIDGKGVGDVGRSVLKERRALSEDGLVVVNMWFDEETGIVTYGPEIVSRGFVFETATGHLIEDAKCVVLECVDNVDFDEPDRTEKIKVQVKTALKQYFYFAIKRRPVILTFIQEV